MGLFMPSNPPKTLLLSPTAAFLNAKAANLRPFLSKREIIGTGDQSLVLKNGDYSVYLVTKRHIAEKFKLLNEAIRLPKINPSFHIPQFVASNENLQDLIDPNCTDKNAKMFKNNFRLYGTLCKENEVYELPYYDGTLEVLNNLHFEKEDITTLEKKLNAALVLLHSKNLTHNDISLKNVFYTNRPHLNFYLGDFGSITKNSAKDHDYAKQKDLNAVQRIIRKAKEILETKRKTKAKISSQMAKQYPSLMNAKLKKLGLADNKENRTSPKRRLLK